MSIQRVIRRAINVWQQCADLFRSTGAKDDFSTQGHARFINALENALGILEPCCSISIEKPIQKAKEPPPSNISKEDTSNLFEMLDVENASDHDPGVAVADVTPAKKQPSSKVNPTLDVYILEILSELELAFSIFCFFEDLNHTEDFLIAPWKSYKEGKLDVIPRFFGTTDSP